MPLKVISKNNNKLSIQVTNDSPSNPKQKNTQIQQTTSITSEQPSSPPTPIQDPPPSPPTSKRTSTRKRKSPDTPSDTSQGSPTQSNSPQDKQELYKQKKAQCIYRLHTPTIGQTIIRTKDKIYSKSVELTLYEQDDKGQKTLKEQVVVKQGSKLQMFGNEKVWIVAGMSKPISGHQITLYLFPKDGPIQDFPLLDVVKKVEGDDVGTEDLVVAQLWWANLLRQEAEKSEKTKEKAAKKRVIKKEGQRTQERTPTPQLKSVVQEALAEVKVELLGIREELRALRETFKADKVEERDSYLQLARVFKQ